MSATICDIAAFGAVFCLCWVVFFALHLAAVTGGLVSGVGKSTVVLALIAAVVTGGGSQVWLGAWFSSPAVHFVISLAAPFSFVGFCGNYILVGPVTIDRSITLSILSALADSRTKGLTVAKLEEEVPFDRIFAKRLRELGRTRNLEIQDEVRITPRGLRVRAAYKWLARVLKVDFQ
jgi:hypothetical protein